MPTPPGKPPRAHDDDDPLLLRSHLAVAAAVQHRGQRAEMNFISSTCADSSERLGTFLNGKPTMLQIRPQRAQQMHPRPCRPVAAFDMPQRAILSTVGLSLA